MPRWPLPKNHHRLKVEASASRRPQGSAIKTALETLATLTKLREETSGEKKASRNSTHKAPNKTLNKETTATASLENFDRMSIKAAEKVITSYSTSFSFATHVLEPELRTDIRNLYAMVRTADEIVDGTAHAAGLTSAQTAQLLADYEREVLLAPHAATARRSSHACLRHLGPSVPFQRRTCACFFRFHAQRRHQSYIRCRQRLPRLHLWLR